MLARNAQITWGSGLPWPHQKLPGYPAMPGMPIGTPPRMPTPPGAGPSAGPTTPPVTSLPPVTPPLTPVTPPGHTPSGLTRTGPTTTMPLPPTPKASPTTTPPPFNFTSNTGTSETTQKKADKMFDELIKTAGLNSDLIDRLKKLTNTEVIDLYEGLSLIEISLLDAINGKNLKTKYKDAIKKYHPDVNPHDNSKNTHLIQIITSAHNIIKNKLK
jgi:predicted Zn-dependent protease with MMP-like domain